MTSCFLLSYDYNERKKKINTDLVVMLRWTGCLSGSTLVLVQGCSPWKAALVLPAVQLEGLQWLSSLLSKPVSQQ